MQKINIHQLLVNIKKLDPKIYKMVKPFIGETEDFTKDGFFYFLMANKISDGYENSLIEFVNQCFLDQEITIKKPITENKLKDKTQTFMNRKYNCTVANIDGGCYDILEVNSSNCNISNVIVRKKLIIDCTVVNGVVKVYPSCVIDINCTNDNLKILQI